MIKNKAPKDPRRQTVMISSILLLIALPLVILGVTQQNLDIRNRAYEELEVNEENPCVISFPNVNPYTLEVGKSFTVLVDSEISNDRIASLSISDSTGAEIYTEEFENNPASIATSFTYTPEKSGEIAILGVISTQANDSVACKISSPYDVQGANAVSTNSAPEFTSTINTSAQILKTGDTFEYILKATDADGDRINYSTSFTPVNNWLKQTVIEDGSNGKLTIKFRGNATQPASYLANVFIHDGYSTHLKSQSWVINVDLAENDIPIITVIEPSQSLRINRGENFTAKWEAQDFNLIAKYKLYMSQNPANPDTWVAIDENVLPKTTQYSIETEELRAGTYKLIAQAVDNQNPEKIGTALSDEIVLSQVYISSPNDDNKDTETPDDIVTLAEPQVTNMSPTSTNAITNPRPTIKATIIAGEQATIVDDEISFFMDSTNRTDTISINKISETSYTLIYQPEEDLTSGLHKAEIYFKDSNGQEITKDWTFTIENDTSKINNDSFNILGIEIPRRTGIIILVGIGIVVLAIIVPIIIFSLWREDEDSKETVPSINPKIPTTPSPQMPTYSDLTKETEVKEMVETTPVTENPADVWDNYAAAKPEEKTEPEQQKDPITESTPVIPTETPNKEALLTPQQTTEEQNKEPEPIPLKMTPPAETKQDVITEPTPPPQPTVPEPVIPEPVIPEVSQEENEEKAMQQLYQQIQQAKEETPSE